MVRSLVIAAALLGCGDSQLAELEAIRDEVCACKTPACGEAALKKVRQDKLQTNRKMQRVANEMLDCMSKLTDAERPSTDPDAETPSTDPDAAPPAPATP